MRLRYVLLLTSAAGAIGALLLAFDMHHRFRIAQRESIVNNIQPAADSVMLFGEPYLLGLVSLAFLFVGIFLMIVSNPEKPAKLEPKPIEKSAAENIVAVAAPVPAPEPVPVVEVAPPVPADQPVPAATNPESTPTN